MKTIDISDLCTDGLDLTDSEHFTIYQDAFLTKIEEVIVPYYADLKKVDQFDTILLKIEFAPDLESFLKNFTELDSYLNQNNITLITCL